MNKKKRRGPRRLPRARKARLRTKRRRAASRRPRPRKAMERMSKRKRRQELLQQVQRLLKIRQRRL
jgi:hypothetical protein